MFKTAVDKFNKIKYGRHNQWDKIDKKAFIVSTGRTGTEFLAHFFQDNCCRVMSLHEPSPDLFDLGINGLREKLSSKEIQDRLRESRSVTLRDAVSAKAHYYIESNWNLSLLLPHLRPVFGCYKFIFIVRDPAGFVRSSFNKKHSPRQYGLYSDNDPRLRLNPRDIENDIYRNDWPRFSRFQKICWHFYTYNSKILDFIDQNDTDHFIVKFEDLFGNSKFTINKIIDFLRLRESVRSSEEEILAYLKKPMNISRNSVLPSFSDWSEEQKEQFAEIMRDLPNRLNYSIKNS